MTRNEMIDWLRNRGIVATQGARDVAPKNPDGSFTGQVITVHFVDAILRDQTNGNVIVRRIEDADLTEEATARVATEMHGELRERAIATQRLVQAEQESFMS